MDPCKADWSDSISRLGMDDPSSMANGFVLHRLFFPSEVWSLPLVPAMLVFQFLEKRFGEECIGCRNRGRCWAMQERGGQTLGCLQNAEPDILPKHFLCGDTQVLQDLRRSTPKGKRCVERMQLPSVATNECISCESGLGARVLNQALAVEPKRQVLCPPTRPVSRDDPLWGSPLSCGCGSECRTGLHPVGVSEAR